MSASQYRRYRAVLGLLFLVWGAVAIGIIGYWAELPLLLKGVAVAVGFVLVPDITTFIQLFSSYKRYSREGLE
jgi:hypothetical protein